MSRRWRCVWQQQKAGGGGASFWPLCWAPAGRHGVVSWAGDTAPHTTPRRQPARSTARTKEVTRSPCTLTRGLETRREGEAARASGEQAREAAGGCGGQEAADHVLGWGQDGRPLLARWVPSPTSHVSTDNTQYAGTVLAATLSLGPAAVWPLSNPLNMQMTIWIFRGIKNFPSQP